MPDPSLEPGRTPRTPPEMNAEQSRKPVAPAKRPVAGRKQSRPWAVRKIDTPAWVEKIEQF